MTAYADAFSGLPREVWLLSGAMLVNRAGTMVLPFLSLYLTQRLGFTATTAGQIIGCFGVGSMAGSLLGGQLSDRVSPLRVQELSLLASGVGFLVLTRLETFLPLAVGVFLVALVSDAFRPALMVAVSHYSPPSVSKRSFALIRLAVNLGMAVGPAIAGILAHTSYVLLFVGDAVTCWAAALILLVTLGGGTGNHRDGHDPAGAPVRTVWRDGPFLVFLLLISVLGMIFFQVWTTMPLYLRSFYGLAERGIGLLLSINALLIVLFEMLLIRSVERFDGLRTVGVGALLVCLGFALLPFGPPYGMAVLAIVLLTIGEMLAMPVSNTLVAGRAARSHTGRYMGLYTLAFSLAFVTGPVAGMAVYQYLGAKTLWIGIGGLGFVLGPGFVALSRSFAKQR